MIITGMIFDALARTYRMTVLFFVHLSAIV